MRDQSLINVNGGLICGGKPAVRKYDYYFKPTFKGG